MLDDRERNALCELEQQLATDDPAFVHSFDRRQECMSGPPRRRRAARIAVAIALAVCLLLVLLGSPAGALVVAVTASSGWLVWRFSGHLDPRALP
jgi:hypothetical protein